MVETLPSPALISAEEVTILPYEHWRSCHHADCTYDRPAF